MSGEGGGSVQLESKLDDTNEELQVSLVGQNNLGRSQEV